MKILRDLYAKCKQDVRTDIPLSELRVGLKCGGSDGFSGITANPLLGMFSDFLIAQGGTSVLTEVPEMFGAETILMNRCENKDLFNQTVHLINDFKEYCRARNFKILAQRYVRNQKEIRFRPNLLAQWGIFVITR